MMSFIGHQQPQSPTSTESWDLDKNSWASFLVCLSSYSFASNGLFTSGNERGSAPQITSRMWIGSHDAASILMTFGDRIFRHVDA